MNMSDILKHYDKKHKNILEVQTKKQINDTKKRNKTYSDRRKKIRMEYMTWRNSENSRRDN